MATKKMTDEHKKALAEGRQASRKVKAYLEAINSTRPTRGRKRDPEKAKQRLATIDTEIAAADPLGRLQLAQEKIGLQRFLAQADQGDAPDLDQLRADFVAVAKAYSESKGISAAAWREVGVDRATLKEAGIL